MKINTRLLKTVGKILRLDLSVQDIKDLVSNTEHLYPGQRDHMNGFKKKKYLRGTLVGATQIFSAVFIKALGRLELIDGYHRAYGISIEEIMPNPSYPFYLDVYVVENRAASNKLFEQFNNLAAAKKATCWFQSGLNECGQLHKIKSKLVIRKGKATAVQYAAGLRGSKHTKEATIAMIEGIKLVDSWGLIPAHHEVGGLVGAYYAIAQHCSDKALAQGFICAINNKSWNRYCTSKGYKVVEAYHALLKEEAGGTGFAANDFAFTSCLAMFAQFAYMEKRKAKVPKQENMLLAQFIDVMKKL